MSNRRDQVSDTDSMAAEAASQIFRNMTPQRKVELVEDANRTARELALAGIRARYPKATADEQDRLLLGVVLGEEVAARVYGPPPSA